MTSKLCSITTTVLPDSTNLCKERSNFCISSKWRPVVGSSKIYNVLPVLLLDNSRANLIRCASPPDKVGDGCPNFMYSIPTSWSVCNILAILGIALKCCSASWTSISKTSAIDLFLYLTDRVSWLYLAPLQILHFTQTSAKNCSSIFLAPFPSQASQRPPLTLKLNRPGL